MTNSVTFPTTMGGDGSTVTDDDNATTGLANGGAILRLVPMFTQMIAVCAWVMNTVSASVTSVASSVLTAANSAIAANTSASNANASAIAAANYSAAINDTSTTSDTIALGSTTVTTQAAKQFAVGQWVTMASTGTPTNFMFGQITAYSATTLTVNVTSIGGSGTFTAWNISLSGIQGIQGIQGVSGIPTTRLYFGRG